jgi:3D-(3,5/4)-trihydroxycyclohexane-1,2-dione acylhydrolase (decyclizing)
MRVLTDPVETGAVTICLPEDVQAEIIEVPEEFLADREWHIRRPRAEGSVLAEAARVISSAKAPLIIAGGGVIYSDAHHALQKFVEQTKIPVSASQAGVGSLNWDHPQYLGSVGATGTTASNRLAKEADVVIGIGTRYSDFTTSSRTAFQNPDVRFININIASFDAFKHGSALPVVADARETLTELTSLLSSFQVSADYAARATKEKREWDAVLDAAFVDQKRALPSQTEIIHAVQSASDANDTVICAAGSLPGDLHKLWRVRSPLGYHVEYAFSCMGYEIAAGLGAARAGAMPIVMVGDGSYLMMHTEIVSAVAEGLKFVIVLIQNHGFASIGHLSESIGSQRFGTQYRFHDALGNNFESGKKLPVDLAANAASLGIDVISINESPSAIADLHAAVKKAKASKTATLIHINSDPLLYSPSGEGWWDVPIAPISTLKSTQEAYEKYSVDIKKQRPLLGNGIKDKK